jgi:hypothetical protein
LEWLDLSVGDRIEPTLADDMALERGNA